MAEQYQGGSLGYGAEYDRLADNLKQIQDHARTLINIGAGRELNGTDYMNRQLALISRMNDIKSGRAAGNDAINSSINATRSGMETVLALAPQIKADSSRIRSQAGLVNTQGNAILGDADKLAALVPQLDPYRDKLTGYGDDLAALARMYEGEQKDMFGQGRALVMQDPSAGGLAGEYMNQYELLSPDRYVSRAASDTQSSFDNAEAQQGRNLSRRGVSLGSGAATAFTQQLNRAKATALAAAKTAARQQGIDERGKWINQMTSAADTLYNVGLKQGDAARGALASAGDMAKGAAGIVSEQGDMLKGAAGLRQAAAGLFSNAASIFGNAASLDMSYAQMSKGAWDSLAAAMNNAAQYYSEAANQYNRSWGGGGTRVGSSPAKEQPQSEPAGAWKDLTHGKASHADGAAWVWDPNAEA